MINKRYTIETTVNRKYYIINCNVESAYVVLKKQCGTVGRCKSKYLLSTIISKMVYTCMVMNANLYSVIYFASYFYLYMAADGKFNTLDNLNLSPGDFYFFNSTE